MNFAIVLGWILIADDISLKSAPVAKNFKVAINLRLGDMASRMTVFC